MKRTVFCAALLLAVMVIPFLEILIIPAVHVRRDGRRSFTDRVHDVYRRVLAWTFRHGWLTISLGAASVAVSLLIATQLKFRMVPIFLTTATTAVGVVPMMLGGSTFWAPVGVTIFAGGIGSLILVVTILPVLYSKIYK